MKKLFHRKEKNGWHHVYVAPGHSDAPGLLLSLYPHSPHYSQQAITMAELLDTYGDFDEGAGIEPCQGMDFETWRQAKSDHFRSQGWNLEAAVARLTNRGDAHPDLLFGQWAIGQPPDNRDLR